MLEIVGNTNIDFMGKRKIALFISGFLVILGLLAIIQIARGAANLGIDFSGGTAVQLKFENPTYGSSCDKPTLPTALSRPTRASLMAAAKLGTTSSINLGKSYSTECANGPTTVNPYDR